MKLETFFEKFELFADAPNAVAKMRELVLRMATSGRVAEQDPADPPGSEVLKEITEVRDHLVERRGANNRTEGKRIPAGDTIDLPPSWARCMIAEVCDLQTGATPSRMENSYFGGDIPWLVSGDINKREITACDGRITKEGLDNSNCKVIPANSVLIALNGQGKTRATVAVLRMPAALNQSLVAIVPFSRELLLPEYIFWNLRGRYYAIRDITGQDQRRGLNMKLIGQLSIPIPPFAEQKRIVAKVHELMALCDRLEAQQQERETRHATLGRAALVRFSDAPTPANLELLFHRSYSIPPADLRKSILTLAVQGRLVPQDPNGVHEYAGPKYKESELSRLTADLALPPSWKLASLTDVAAHIADCPHSTPKWTAGGKVCVRTNQFSPGHLDLSESKYVSDATFEERIARIRPKADDILYSREGGILGVACRVPAGVELCLGQRMMLVRSGSAVAPAFLEMVLNAPLIVDIARKQTTGGAAPRVNVATVKAYPIPLPPLTEQRRIVAKVGELMALVDQLEKQQEAAKSTGAALLEAVVHELLNPTAKIISFPIVERDSLSDRAAIGCYAIQRLSDQRTFGRTAAVKVLYMAEAHLGLDLGGRYMRDAAGPLDKWIYKFEEEAAREQWFSVVEGATKEGHRKIDYRKGSNLSAKAQEASSRFSAVQRSEFDRMLALLAQKPTVEVEIIATLFAAWNDFLIDGRQPNDDEVVREVRENWHPSKQRFSQAELRSWLAWLRQHALVPQGKGPHTLGQQGKLQLH